MSRKIPSGNVTSRNKRTSKRVRLSGRALDILEDMDNGTDPHLEEWDLEEVIRGYPRAKDGSFKGRPPSVIPRAVHEELVRRVRTNVAHELLAIVSDHAAPLLRKISQMKEVPPDQVPGLRLQAQVVQDLLDRFVVSKTEKIEISGAMKYEEIIQHVTIERDVPLEEDEDIVDAEIVDEEDDEFVFDD